MSRETKKQVAGNVIAAYRTATNQDVAFDALAAEALGVSVTDLHCLNIIEARNGLTAGELARESGLTTGAVTAVVDRLDRAGYARRVPDQHDRRKVNVEVTPAFYGSAGEIWGPVADEWQRRLTTRFTTEELHTIADFLDEVAELTVEQAERVRNRPGAAG
jgi:DNA-binding MarR family transcriptional regulator